MNDFANVVVPAKTLADLFNLTIRRVQQLAQDGTIPRAERGKYPLVGAVRGYVKFLQDRSMLQGGGIVDLSHEAARIKKLTADRLQREEDEASGKLISTEQTARAVQEMDRAIVRRLMQLPAKLAARVVIMEKPSDVERALRSELRDCLRGIEDGRLPEIIATAIAKGGSLETAARLDNKRVGRKRKAAQ